MDTPREPALRFRVLTPEDRAEAAAIAGEAFAGNPFYEAALGFDRAAFEAYWDAFLALALADRSARVLGVDVEDGLGAVVVIAYHGFPAPAGAIRFVATLLTRIGPRRTWAYLRFVGAYGRAMRRPRAEEREEARGFWLMARTRAARPRIGGALARFAAEQAVRDGKRICTGFVDAGNEPLLHFYGRMGYRIGPRFRFGARWAATVELSLGERPC